MCLTCRSPMMPASEASAGIAFLTPLEAATSACRTIAPIVTAPLSVFSAFRSPIALRSIRSVGEDSRSFIACTRLWPPARYLPSSFLEARARASFTFEGRWYSNACIAILLGSLAHGAPHGLRRGGHREVLDAEGIGDGVHHRRRRADRPRLAATLHAERVVRAGSLARVHLEQRHVACARDGVVAEGSGDQLPRAVVAAAFGERLPDALRESAVHLTLDDHRVDDLAEVVHRGEGDDLRRAGVAVDLDLADIAARGEGEVRRVVERVLVEAGLEPVERIVVRHVGRERHFAEGLLPVGARHLEHAVVVLDVGLRRLEQMRGDLPALGDDLVERFHYRGPTDRDGP